MPQCRRFQARQSPGRGANVSSGFARYHGFSERDPGAEVSVEGEALSNNAGSAMRGVPSPCTRACTHTQAHTHAHRRACRVPQGGQLHGYVAQGQGAWPGFGPARGHWDLPRTQFPHREVGMMVHARPAWEEGAGNTNQVPDGEGSTERESEAADAVPRPAGGDRRGWHCPGSSGRGRRSEGAPAWGCMPEAGALPRTGQGLVPPPVHPRRCQRGR